MTLTNLYRKALEKLQVAAAGEQVDADDTMLVSGKYAAIYEMLLTKGLVSWAATDEVPEFAVIPLTNALAWASAAEFGQDPNRYAAEGAIDLQGESLAERQLRRQLYKSYVAYPASSEYY